MVVARNEMKKPAPHAKTNFRIFQKKLFISIIFFLIIIPSKNFAQQETPDLITDRPDLTDSPIVLPADFFQIETGFVYEKQKFVLEKSNTENDNLILGSTLLRYGISSNWEFRFGGEYLVGKSKVDEIESDIKGMQNIFIGAKYQFRRDKDILTNAGFIFRLGLPFGNEKLRPDKIEPEIALALEHDFTDQIFLSTNIGAMYSSTAKKNVYNVSTSFEYGFTYELSVFAEVFSNFISDFSPNHNLDFGCSYLLKKNVQIDFSLGTILFSNETDYFGNLGFSIRLPR